MAATDPNPNVDPTITGQELGLIRMSVFTRIYMFMEIYITILMVQTH